MGEIPESLKSTFQSSIWIVLSHFQIDHTFPGILLGKKEYSVSKESPTSNDIKAFTKTLEQRALLKLKCSQFPKHQEWKCQENSKIQNFRYLVFLKKPFQGEKVTKCSNSIPIRLLRRNFNKKQISAVRIRKSEHGP